MTGKTPQPPAPDLEAGYNNRAAVPGHPAIIARWTAEAEATRAAHPPLVLPYGPGERQAMDLFEAPPAAGQDHAPVVVFIHGGYWQALDRSVFSWVAPALLHHGISVAIAGYDLCPAVRPGEIVRQMRDATTLLRARTGVRPMVTGHSVGGHLSACMLSEGRASAAVSISGVFDLRPLVQTSLNDALGLDENGAAALSPIFWPPPNGGAPGGTVLDCFVGGAETSAFIRQSRDMVEHWGSRGADTRFEGLDGLDHFTVLDPLADPDSGLVQRIAMLARS